MSGGEDALELVHALLGWRQGAGRRVRHQLLSLEIRQETGGREALRALPGDDRDPRRVAVDAVRLLGRYQPVRSQFLLQGDVRIDVALPFEIGGPHEPL